MPLSLAELRYRAADLVRQPRAGHAKNRPQPFATKLARREFLFGRYQQLSAPVPGAVKQARR